MCHVNKKTTTNLFDCNVFFSRFFLYKATQSYNYEKHTHIMVTDSTEKHSHGTAPGEARENLPESFSVVWLRSFNVEFLTFSRLKFFFWLNFQ